VQEQPGHHDHRAPKDRSAQEQYGPAHEVIVAPGGRLAELIAEPRFEVNSVHGQGVKRLAPGLRVEANAPDGLIEAFSVADARGFNLCVQWHPEWRAEANPVSRRLLDAFGRACEAYRAARVLRRDRHRGPDPDR
jgi:putative glutamine amidotransferase